MADGAVFIDRDGQHFSDILNFLRNGSVTLPETEKARLDLLSEAGYYGLSGLQEALVGQGLVERELGPLNVALRERENELRLMFAQDPSNSAICDPHVDLIDVYANLELFEPAKDQGWQQVKGHMVFMANSEWAGKEARKTSGGGLSTV
jgi:hypothetical protein